MELVLVAGEEAVLPGLFVDRCVNRLRAEFYGLACIDVCVGFIGFDGEW